MHKMHVECSRSKCYHSFDSHKICSQCFRVASLNGHLVDIISKKAGELLIFESEFGRQLNKISYR